MTVALWALHKKANFWRPHAARCASATASCVLDVAVERDASGSDGSAILEDGLDSIRTGSEARSAQ